MSTIPHYSTLGSGPTILMLHGIGGGHLAFAPQLETLAQAGFRAVAWDMPGYGHSAPIEPYTFKGLAERCIHLIESLMPAGRPPLTLLGHSMGGMVAQEFAAHWPQRVSALVLACTSPAFGRPGGDWQQAFLRDRLALLDAGQGMAAVAARLVPSMVAPGVPEQARQAASRIMSAVPEPTYRAALAALVHFDRRAALPAISVPTLCLAAAHDRTAPPEVMQRMAAHIPGAAFCCLEGAGHIANVEQPEAFNAAVVEFLSQHFKNT